MTCCPGDRGDSSHECATDAEYMDVHVTVGRRMPEEKAWNESILAYFTAPAPRCGIIASYSGGYLRDAKRQ